VENCKTIVERFGGLHPAGGGEKLWQNCRKILRALLQKIFLQFFHHYSLPPLPVEGPQNLSTIVLQFFHNSSLCGRIWCIRIGLEKNCRRNNRRKIVETFGECRHWSPRGTYLYLLRIRCLIALPLLAPRFLHNSSSA
jgi:hypothetical protein